MLANWEKIFLNRISTVKFLQICLYLAIIQRRNAVGLLQREAGNEFHVCSVWKDQKSFTQAEQETRLIVSALTSRSWTEKFCRATTKSCHRRRAPGKETMIGSQWKFLHRLALALTPILPPLHLFCSAPPPSPRPLQSIRLMNFYLAQTVLNSIWTCAYNYLLRVSKVTTHSLISMHYQLTNLIAGRLIRSSVIGAELRRNTEWKIIMHKGLHTHSPSLPLFFYSQTATRTHKHKHTHTAH